MSKAYPEPFARFTPSSRRPIRFVVTDIDDTLTENGALAAPTLDALERLRRAGVAVVAVTAASAGWCDGIARMWPIDGVVAENGGLYFLKPRGGRVPERRFWHTAAAREAAAGRLAALAARLVAEVPGATVAADQPYRLTSLAFDAPDSPAVADRILNRLAAAGASATVIRFLDRMTSSPRWITRGAGGSGFVEVVDRLLRQDMRG